MIADRSLVVQDGIRLASPLAIVVATVLFFAGHNQPGGGFAGGLVLGAVMALRSATGLSVPQHPVRMMAGGGVIIGIVALAPLAIGDVVLDQYIWETTFPVLGKVKAGTALIFDTGVVLVVVGLILAMLDALSMAGEPDTISDIATDPVPDRTTQTNPTSTSRTSTSPVDTAPVETLPINTSPINTPPGRPEVAP